MATLRGGNHLELEMSQACYVRNATRLWNLAFNPLPPRVMESTDRLARLVLFLRSALVSNVPICTVVERSLYTQVPKYMTRDAVLDVVDQCHWTEQWEGPLTTEREALIKCLGGSHNAGLVAQPKTQGEEAAESANNRALAATISDEAAMTFSGEYSDYYTASIVESIRLALKNPELQ